MTAQDKPAYICRRCLLQDLPGKEAEYYKSVLIYRKELAEKNQGVSDTVYEERLAVCLSCDELVNGTCKQCGCYVQMRAAAKKMGCPYPNLDKWKL